MGCGEGGGLMKIKKNRCSAKLLRKRRRRVVVVAGVEGRRQHREYTKFFATALHLY